MHRKSSRDLKARQFSDLTTATVSSFGPKHPSQPHNVTGHQPQHQYIIAIPIGFHAHPLSPPRPDFTCRTLCSSSNARNQGHGGRKTYKLVRTYKLPIYVGVDIIMYLGRQVGRYFIFSESHLKSRLHRAATRETFDPNPNFFPTKRQWEK